MVELWEAALSVISGQSEYYPLGHCQQELQYPDSLMHSLATSQDDHGTSILLVGPSALLHLAAVQRTLQRVTSHGDRIIHLHGGFSTEPSVILSAIEDALECEEALSTFESMSRAIVSWLEQHRKQRIYILLSAFDRFAAAGSQHLLYSVFELCGMARVTVLGMSTRCDVMDMLEKRVKSRFSQNIVYLTHPRDFDAYLAAVRDALVCPVLLETADKTARKRYVDSVDRTLQDRALCQHLEGLYEKSRDPLEALKIFVDALLECSRAKGISLATVMAELEEEDPTADRLPTLCVAEWCALVAMKRCAEKHPQDPVNFDRLYEEYSSGFAASARTNDAATLARKFSRTVLRAAVDMLVAKGIIQTGRSHDRGGLGGETVGTREDICSRFPLGRLPELLPMDSSCPDVLRRLATEVL